MLVSNGLKKILIGAKTKCKCLERGIRNKKANIMRECIHQLIRQTIGLRSVSPKRYVIMSMDINRATKPEVGEIFQ